MSFSLGGVSCAVHFHFCIREMFYRCEITQRDLSALDSCQGPSKLINLNIIVSPSSQIHKPPERFRTPNGTIKTTIKLLTSWDATCL